MHLLLTIAIERLLVVPAVNAAAAVAGVIKHIKLIFNRRV